jgi:hypothetical protein
MDISSELKHSIKQMEELKLKMDCTKSHRVVIDFEKLLKALQTFMDGGEDIQLRIRTARKCCENPIISCTQQELPHGWLRAMQDVISDEIKRVCPQFNDDPPANLLALAQEHRLKNVIDICGEISGIAFRYTDDPRKVAEELGKLKVARKLQTAIRCDSIGDDFSGILVAMFWDNGGGAKKVLHNFNGDAIFAEQTHCREEELRFVRDNGGCYKIISKVDGKVLDVGWGQNENGTRIYFWDDKELHHPEMNNENQRWRIQNLDWNYHGIGDALALGPSHALQSALDMGGSNGSAHLWEYHGGWQQQFGIWRM